MLPFRAARFLLGQRQLWPVAIAPALINLVLFVGAALLVLANADLLMGWIWAPPGGVLLGLWYVLYVALIVLGLLAAYVTALLLGGIVASPFNDVLSERTERLLTGTVRSSDASFGREALRSTGSTALVTALYGLTMAPVLLLNLIPGLGSVLAMLLGGCLSACFLAWEYADICLARHGLHLRQKVRLLRSRPALTLGTGVGLTLLFWIPLLNVLIMPAAVVAGTALALTLEDMKT